MMIRAKLDQQDKTSNQDIVDVELEKYHYDNPCKNNYDWKINKEKILEMMSQEERDNNDIELICAIADAVLKRGVEGMMEIEQRCVKTILETQRQHKVA